MSRPTVSWIIRSHNGQIVGPLTTTEVLQRISDGTFVGDEMISSYPQGKWLPLSKEPEFYDQLLSVLEKKADEAGFKKPEKKDRKIDFEETIFMPRPAQKIETKLSPGDQKKNRDDQTRDLAPPILELKAESVDTKKKNIRKIIFISSGLFFVFLLTVIFLLPAGKSSDRIRLLKPQANRQELSSEDAKSKLAKSVAALEKSTIEGAIEAQNELVFLIEGQNRNLEARALLCYVYKELWPFSYQDLEDQKTIEAMVQSTRALNLTSAHGQFCEAIRLQNTGRFREARAQLDSLLESAGSFSLLPIGYHLKGEALESDREYENAAAYYEKSGEMWSTWARPRLSLAHLYYKRKMYQEAYSALQNTLPQHAKNKERYVLIGMLDVKGFNRKDSALRILEGALKQPGILQTKFESEAWLILAELWLERNEKSKALDAAQKAYRLSPQNKGARDLVVRLGGDEKIEGNRQNQEAMMLGEQYMRQGDFLSAQAEFKAAFEINPKNAEAALKAGKCLWQLNQTFDAIDWLNKAIRSNPKLITAYVTQADYLSQRYDFQTASQLLNRAQQQTGQNFEILRGFAWLEFRKNNMQGAIQFGERAKVLFEGDVETYILLSKAYRLRALSISPDTAKTIAERDEAIKNMKSYATRAVELDATNTEAQVAYGEMLSAQHGVETGIQYFNELIKKFSYTNEYRVALADLLKREERYQQARGLYEQVLIVDPKNKKCLLGLGQAQRALGQNEAALKTFLNAAIADPSDAEAFYQAGQTLIELNRFDLAISNYQKALKVNPQYPRLYYSIGAAHFLKGNLDEAKKAALEERQINPNLSDPIVLLAEIYMASKLYSECAKEYSLALKLRQVAELYVKAATCYRQSGSLEIAQDMLSLAKQREDGYAEIYKEQGALFQLKGDNDAALESYQMYLELSPNAPDRGQIQTMIRSLGG